MYAPELYESAQTKSTVDVFGGYNHGVRISEGEFYEMKNMTGEAYPALSPRSRRGTVRRLSDCGGLCAKNELAYVEDGVLHYGSFEMELNPSVTSERQLISMGAYLVIFPDMMYLNTSDTSDCGSIYGKPESYSGAMTLTLCDGEKNEIKLHNLLLSTYRSADSRGTLCDTDVFMTRAMPTAKDEYIFIDPTDSSESKMYLPGIADGYCFMGYAKAEYTVEAIVMGWGTTSDGTEKLRIEKDDGGWYIQTRWYELYGFLSYERSQDEWYSLEKYFKEYPNGRPIYGRINCKRTYRGETVSRQYNISVLPSYKRQWNPVSEGDLRLYENGDGTAVIQRCTQYMSDAYTTWREPSCWESVPTYVRIKLEGSEIGTDFQAVSESGGSELLRITYAKELPAYYFADLLTKYSDSAVNLIKESTDYYATDTVLVSGCMNMVTSYKTEGRLVLHKLPPSKPLDFVIECGNRLWGCRYGKNLEGRFVNEIYATEQGSFKNWDVMNGTSTDSYAVTLGSDGAFTGAVNYRGCPVFFKENCRHIIYGSYPESYQLSTDTETGVQAGSHGSICIIRGLLYYKARDGIYRFDGSDCKKISSALGTEEYTDAVGGEIDGRYYVAMTGSGGRREMFVYSVDRGLWHKEDETGARCFARHGGELYFYDEKAGALMSVKGSVGTLEKPVEWFVETGEIGYSSSEAKYIDKLKIRIYLPSGSKLGIYIEYDSDGYFEYVGGLEGSAKQVFTLPISPRRCDHFKLRIKGEGDCRIYGISKIIEEGGEA